MVAARSSDDASRPVGRAAVRAATILLLGLSIGYLGWGFRQLLVGESPVAAIDLEARWLENRYVLQGQNPYDVYTTSIGEPRATGRDASIDPDLGPVWLVGYPPWSYVPASLLVPPIAAFGPVRAWFAALSALSLAFLALWAHRGLRRRDPELALLGAATVLGLTPNLFTLSAGQYGLVVNALVVGSFLLAERGHRTGAGAALGIALLKPQSAGTFVIAHLASGNLRAVAIAAALAGAFAAAALAWIDTGPIEYFRDMAGIPLGDGYGFYSWAVALGGDPAFWAPALGIGGAIVTAALLWRHRAASLWTHLAIAAVVGRLWSYHGIYDDVMLVFLPLALLRAWSEGRGGRRVPAAWLAVLATLAAPIPYLPQRDWASLQVAHVAIWIAGLAVLLRAEEATSGTPDRRSRTRRWRTRTSG